MNRKIKEKTRIIVKDISKLKKYGFIERYGCLEHPSGNTNIYGRMSYDITVKKIKERGYEEYILLFYNPSGNCMRILCELYCAGIVDFINLNSKEERIARRKEKIRELEREIEEIEEND